MVGKTKLWEAAFPPCPNRWAWSGLSGGLLVADLSSSAGF